MNAAGVQQLSALAELFQYALDSCSPESVAILGVAGGNGLERIDPKITKRTVGVDINQEYLDAVRRRFAALPGLELHRCDLAQNNACRLAPVALVHAALVFEHAGVDVPLENALPLVAPGGRLSVVLQLPGESGQAVECTGYDSMQALKDDFTLIDPAEFQDLLAQRGFRLIEEKRRAVPAGKALWLGIFSACP